MTDILVEQIKLLPIPEDTEKNNRTWLAPLELTDNAKSLPAFIELVDQFMEASKGNRKEPHLDKPPHNGLTVLALHCCFMVFKVRANAGFFLLPLLLVMPPLVFKSRKKESGEEETIWLGASCLSTSDQS